MTTSRDEILGRLRAAVGSASGGAAVVARRLADPSPHVIPARARGEPADLVERFVAMAKEASATVVRLTDPASVPRAVLDYALARDLPPAVVAAPARALEHLPWTSAQRLVVRFGLPTPADRLSLTEVSAGIAETGTLMVRSGATAPNTLHFLPEAHVAVLPASAVVGAYEDAWSRLRNDVGDQPPRIVTLITGPSRSSDIERTLAIGVHGPRMLHILVIDGA
jgi:L-lactate dehydrogenase complex protein LldG